MERKCTFCQHEGELHEVEAPAIRICTACRHKLETHICVICTGCDTLIWLPKTPDNVMIAAEYGGISPQHVMENPMLHQIAKCKNCYRGAKDFMVEGRFLH